MKKMRWTFFIYGISLLILCSCTSYRKFGRRIAQPRGYFVEERGFMQQSYPAPIAPLPPNYEETHYYFPTRSSGAPLPISPPNCGSNYPGPHPMYYQ